MSFLRFIGILITLAFLLTSCSSKISQIDYDKKNYEYEQLKMRYELLKKENGGDIVSIPITNNPQTQITSEISVADYEELKRNYATLMQQNTALETAYNELHEKQQNPKSAKKIKASKTEMTEYKVLKKEHKKLQKEHSSLKVAYNELKEQEFVGESTTVEVDQTEHEKLKQDYATLETAYNELHEKQLNPKSAKKTKASKTEMAEYKVLKKEHKKLQKEHSSLKVAYNELKEQEFVEESTTTTAEVDLTEHEKLKQNYAALMQKHTTLETDYNELQQQPNPVNPPGTISKTAYTELQIEKTALEKRYTILENRYEALKEMNEESNASSISSAEFVEPAEIDSDLNIGKGTPELEENSIDLGEMVVQSASHNGLFFDFDAYDRTEEYLVLEVAVKNNSQNTLRTFWNADKIQIVDKYGTTYTSNSFRVGVDYASQVDNTLLKKIKDENIVFARFAFEDLPKDFKQIQSLKFIVVIEGEERTIEFTQINISKIEIE